MADNPEPTSRHIEHARKSGCARQAIISCAAATVVTISIATVVGFGGHIAHRLGIGMPSVAGFVAEVAASFRFQYLWLAVALGVLTAVVRCPKWAVLSAVVAIVNLAAVAGLYLPPPDPSGNSTASGAVKSAVRSVAIAQFNAQASTSPSGFNSLARFVDETDPDVVAVEDLSGAWAAQFRGAFPQMSPVIELPMAGGGGIGLYSRIPIQDARLRYFSDAEHGLASITARLLLGGEIVDLVATHPIAPTSPTTLRARNQQLANIASERTRFAQNLIVVGDLNMTSWSPAFGQFAGAMGLRDSRKGFGAQGTWPASLPGWRIPLDHCLASDRFTTLERRVGPNSGSQHLPIFVRLELQES